LERIKYGSGDEPKPAVNDTHLRVYGNHL